MKEEKGSKLLFFSILGTIFITVFITLIVIFIIDKNPKSVDNVLEKFKNGIIKKDAYIIAETIHPNFIKMYENKSNNTYEEELQDMLNTIKNEIIDYDINTDFFVPEKIDFLEFCDNLEENFDIYNINEVRVYSVDVIAKNSNKEYIEFEDNVILFNIDGKWYAFHDDFVDDIVY